MLPVQSYKRVLLSLLCLLGLAALTACVPKSHRFGIILISYKSDLSTDFFRIPENTQNRIEQLTFTPTIGEYYFLVSKNGDKIIFESEPTSSTAEPSDLALEQLHHIYLLDTDSKKLKDMTDIFTVPPTTSPMRVVDWSPNQNQFAVIDYEGNLVFIDSDGNKKDIPIPSLGETHTFINDVKWSPDGKKLALARRNLDHQQQYPGNALLVYDLGSGELIQLANDQEKCGIAAWSPTSQQIAAACTFSIEELAGPPVIRIFNVENPGQPKEHLLFSPCRYPSWSPDGKHLAFECKKGADQWGIFLIDSDGNGIHELRPEKLERTVYIATPFWSPDGTKIVYMALTDDDHSQIYSVNPDGSKNYPLTNRDVLYLIVSVYPLP